MAAGGPQQAKRAFVEVLLSIAALYSVRLQLTRDSLHDVCTKAFKKLSLKVRPEGGSLARAQLLIIARAPTRS